MQNFFLNECSVDAERLPNPDFIYNRFDLWQSFGADIRYTTWHYQDGEQSLYVEVLLQGTEARLGIWLMPLRPEVLRRIAKAIFKAYPEIGKIVIDNATCDFIGRSFRNNHFRIVLPDSVEALDARLSSKGRYNIRREKRLLNEKFQGVTVNCIAAESVQAERVWQKYFEFKSDAKNTNYGLTPQEYCEKYHVTDVYALELGENREIAAMMLSCEQCPVVYLENMAFDENLASFSPGQILYDEYLKLLIKKGKKELYLAGGNYSYKKRYDSIEDAVFKGAIYRNPLQNCTQWANCQARRVYHKLQDTELLIIETIRMKLRGGNNDTV